MHTHVVSRVRVLHFSLINRCVDSRMDRSVGTINSYSRPYSRSSLPPDSACTKQHVLCTITREINLNQYAYSSRPPRLQLTYSIKQAADTRRRHQVLSKEANRNNVREIFLASVIQTNKIIKYYTRVFGILRDFHAISAGWFDLDVALTGDSPRNPQFNTGWAEPCQGPPGFRNRW